MANDCLVTKLKGSVSADLEKLGELTFIVNRPEGQMGATDFSDPYWTSLGTNGYIDGVRAGAAVISEVNSTVISPSISEYVNTEHANYTNSVAFPAAQEGLKVRVGGFTAITELLITENVTCEDIYRLKYCSNLIHLTKRGQQNRPSLKVSDLNDFADTLLSFNNIDIVGKTEELQARNNLQIFAVDASRNFEGSIDNIISAYPNLLTLRTTETKVTGTFDHLGVLTSLIEVQFTDTGVNGVFGSVEGFVATARAAGRTTGTVNCNWCFNFTFNGQTITPKSGITLTWDASTITWDGVTINA